MSEEIINALLEAIADLAPEGTQLDTGEPCSGCGHTIRVVRNGIGFCVSCNPPGRWSAIVRMNIRQQLAEAREHNEHLAQQRLRPRTLAELVAAVRLVVPECGSVWSVREHLACSCGCQVRLLVNSKVYCPGCRLPAEWPAERRKRIMEIVKPALT